MWRRLFDNAMRRFIRRGALEITFADGSQSRYGEATTDPVRVTLHDPALPRKVLLHPELAVGEAYVDQRLTVGQDDLEGFLSLGMRNRLAGHDPAIMRVAQALTAPAQRFFERNPLFRARRNVAHHYDLSGELYDLFLDEDRQYSCAYFPAPGMTLEAAQEAKKHHIARKLCLRPGDRVLDIGCGWGGMALTLARDYRVEVVGVTLSEEQHKVARARVAEAGLQDRIDIRLQDYRQTHGPFDRIVSVGMFEHLGAAHFREYFRHIRRNLTPDGVALIHTIGTQTGPRATGSWVRKYIFPGGYLPAMSEMTGTIERERLTITDLEVWRMHYAETLRHWRTRFERQIDKARALYDDRFCRMWRYYLTSAELSFSVERLAVFQVQIARDKEAVPLTRDYLYSST